MTKLLATLWLGMALLCGSFAASAQPSTFTLAGACERAHSKRSPPPAIKKRTSGLSISAATSIKSFGFFTDVTKEMKKVTWPRPDELRESTVIVLVVCGVIAAFVFGVDWVVSNVMKAIL